MKKIFYAPAKINIVLRVLGRRANGYHDLLMLNEKLELCDEIEIQCRSVEVSKCLSAEDIIKISCDDKNVPCDKTNLCFKAAEIILNELSADLNTLHIHITKRIPVAAGLGGGSSDAAAVLKGLNELLDLNWPREKLSELGVKLGADVPFFLYDGPAICEGIGDKITALNKLPNMWILLINPNFPVSTKWVYEEFDKIASLQLTQKEQDDRSLTRNFKGLEDVARVVHNDLELVTVKKYPEIEQIKKLLVKNGAVRSWMSGSGPTVVGMFDSEGARDAVFEKLNKPEWRVIRTSNKL